MKWLVMPVILIIVQCPVLGYPIHASNEAFNCTVFGEFKNPYTIVEPNGDKNIVLNVDVSLIKSNSNSSSPANVTYSLLDSNDKGYAISDEFTRSFQQDRQILGFSVPLETIPKMLIVSPSRGPRGDKRLLINLGELTNGTNGKVNLQYYGILNSKIESNLKSLDFDLNVTNHDVKELPLSSKNFSLIDQWGWRYDSLPKNAYTGSAFESRFLEPEEIARIKVSFGSMSPLSRPSRLVYEYSNNSSIVLNIDPDRRQLQYISISKNCSCQPCGDTAPKPPALNSSQQRSVLSRLAGKVKATRAVISKSGNLLKSNIHMVKGNGARQKVVLGNHTLIS